MGGVGQRPVSTYKHFPIYMMAGFPSTPSVDSKVAVGEEKCNTEIKNTGTSELKEGSKAEERWA